MVRFVRKPAIAFLLVASAATGLTAQSYYDARKLSFNTNARELAPAFYRNDLVFCSDRKSGVFLSYTDLNDNNLTNLYRVEQKKPGKFDNPQILSRELTTYLFEGPSCFSHDGKTIYFTRTIDISVSLRNRQREDTTFGIFSAELVNGEWTNITAFRYNRPDCNTGYPFLSDDGNLLFFCSDSKEGVGGYDIYVSAWENSHWGQPRNLGANVNTAGNEVFPFLHKSGRLYFASRGHNQRGDLDLFYTVMIDGAWQKPVALEEPFNTSGDDYGLILNATMDTGYFVSDRMGSDDIFMVHSTLPLFQECKEQEENDYCYVFYEPNNIELDTTAFAYEWDLGDGTRIRKLKAEHCFEMPGTYFVQLNVVDKLTKEVALNQASDSFLVEDIEQPYITAPDTVVAGSEIRLDGRKTFLKDFTAGEYYWDFGDGYRSAGLATAHRFNFEGTYELQLGVTGAEGASRRECATRRIIVLPPRR